MTRRTDCAYCFATMPGMHVPGCLHERMERERAEREAGERA